MNRWRTSALLTLSLSTMLSTTLSTALWTAAAGDEPVSFRRDVAPLLLERCLPCHGPQKAEGSYRIDTFARASSAGDSEIPAFVAQDQEGSEALRRIVSDDETERMPADNKPLAGEHVSLLRRWIEQGARFDGDDVNAPLATIVPPKIHPPAPPAYAHTLPITALCFTDEGRQLIASGYHELTVWNVEDGTLAARLANFPQRTLGLSPSADGKRLAAAGGNPGRLGEVRIVELPAAKLLRVVAMNSDVVRDVAFSPDDRRLACASADGSLRVFDSDSGAELMSTSSHSDWVTAVAWSGDGKRIATASRDKTAKVFDAEKGELLASYVGHENAVMGVAFHPDGKQVYSTGEDRKVHRWSIEQAKKEGEAPLGGGGFKLVMSDRLLAPSADRTIRQYDPQSLKETRKYEGAGDWILCTAYDPHQQRVAAGCFNGEIIVWDNAGQELQRWTAAPGRAP